ncbi:MAG: cell division protein FtsQ/DivIB [Acutalibacteraceae bacterium]
MSDSRDNRTDSLGDDGFDWFAESEKMKKSFDSFDTQKERRYGSYEKTPPRGNSVFSDGYSDKSRYTRSSGSYYYTGYSEKSRPVREDSVYNHSEKRSANSSKNTAQRQSTAKRPSASQNKKRQTAENKRTPAKNSSDSRHSYASKNTGSKKASEKTAKKQPVRQSGRQPQARQPSQLQKRASAGEKRRIEKSRESYDKAIRQGKSKDELRKKRSKKKRRARKLKIALTVFAVMVFAVVFAVVFCFTRGAPIAKIEIEGATIYNESEILSAAGISEGDNMLMIRQKTTNEAVTTKLPYISKIKVDYQLPDTLRLVVSETDEKYYIVNGETYICVDENDKVVSDIKKKVKENKYKIEGLGSQEYTVGETFVPDDENGNEKKYEIAKKLAYAIEEAGLENCNVINVENADRIYVVYDSKVWMYLKEDSDFEYEMKFAAQALSDSRTSEIISSSQRCYIDLRLGNQAVFKTGKLS